AASVDIRLQLSMPSGALFRGYAHKLESDAPHTGRRRFHPIVDSWNEVHGITGPSTDNNAVFHGVLIVSSTAGTFGLNWAQGSSSATHSVVRANSNIAIQRVE